MKEITTLKALVDEAAACYKDQIAYRYLYNKEETEKTYLELQADSSAFTRTLQGLGLKKAHVAIMGPTSYEYIVVYLGTVSGGHAIVPIDRELSKEAVCDLLKRADVKMLVYDKQYEEVAQLARESCLEIEYYVTLQQEEEHPETLSLACALEAHREALEIEEAECEVTPETLAAILYTSGTTGQSKGVMLSHKNLIHNVTCIDMRLPQDTVILSVLPIHHAFCFTCDILLGLYAGVTACINDSMMHLARNMKRFSPTLMLVVPMIVESLYYKLCEATKAMPEVPKPMLAAGALGGRLKTIYCGGAYLNPKYIPAFKEFGITLLQGYGMTESAPRITCNYAWESKADSVGKILPGVEVKVVEGELWTRSDSVMMGYYKNPEATGEALQEGWLKTGDLGHVDAEGFVYITGRKKNLIILSNGENVSAEAIENKLQEDPLVAEVLVYGENNFITAEIYPNEEVLKVCGLVEDKAIQLALQMVVDEVNEGAPISRRVHTLKVRGTAFEKTTSRKIKRSYSRTSEV